MGVSEKSVLAALTHAFSPSLAGQRVDAAAIATALDAAAASASFARRIDLKEEPFASSLPAKKADVDRVQVSVVVVDTRRLCETQWCSDCVCVVAADGVLQPSRFVRAV